MGRIEAGIGGRRRRGVLVEIEVQVQRGQSRDDDVPGGDGGGLGEVECPAANFKTGVIAGEGRVFGDQTGSDPRTAGLDVKGLPPGEDAANWQHENGRGAALLEDLNCAGGKEEIEPDLEAALIEKGSVGSGCCKAGTPRWNRVAEQAAVEDSFAAKHERCDRWSLHGGLGGKLIEQTTEI